MIEFCKQDKRVKAFYEKYMETNIKDNTYNIPYPYSVLNKSLYAIKVVKQIEETKPIPININQPQFSPKYVQIHALSCNSKKIKKAENP